MYRRSFIKKSFTVAICGSIIGSGCRKHVEAVSESIDQKPNVVFLLVDDLGWADLGCYGSESYETPNIDKLASQGMLFTDAYAASPICSPTRAAIMSGKYPSRFNLTNFDGNAGPSGRLIPPDPSDYMPLNEVTMAESLKEGGYTTFFAGKWHLGHDEKYYPEHQGFDTNVAGHGYGQPGSYYFPYKHPVHTWSNVPGLEDGREGEYLTDRLTDESVKFINNIGEKPFFLYHCYYSVHTPIEPREDLENKYKAKLAMLPQSEDTPYSSLAGHKMLKSQNNSAYAAMVAAVDESVGRILAALDERGLASNTAVILTSDNGGLFRVTSNHPLKAGKAWLYEGGIRVPLIVKWPGAVKEGTRSEVPVTSTDFYPTILDMAGLPQKPAQHCDGKSLTPLLKGTGKIEREALFWHYPHYHSLGSTPSGAVRSGDYKLIENYEDSGLELYNLKEDPGEQNNLASKEKQKANELRLLLANWLKETKAAMPVPIKGAVTYPRGDPSLPNVLIIGDSISIGYTPFVVDSLAGKANVYRIPTNAQHTGVGLDNLYKWLGSVKWDVIYFNWGLHDICYRNPLSKNQGNRDKINGQLTTSPAEYADNLRQLVKQLQRCRASLIWASTIPVPDNEAGRFKSDVPKYNKIAAGIMTENNITVDDLYSYALQRIDDIQLPGGNVHFSREGSRYLAEKVADSIQSELDELK
jgi:arylsulfatase A